MTEIEIELPAEICKEIEDIVAVTGETVSDLVERALLLGLRAWEESSGG